jgi:hypothetical protein
MFNPNEFKEVADNVLNFESLPDEGKCRTAIGRYYYYIFLKIREIVKEVERDREDGIYGLLNRGAAHRVLPIYFKILACRINHRNLRMKLIKLSDELNELRDRRNEADYQLDSMIDSLMANDVKSRVEELEQIVDTISYEEPENKINIVGLKNILVYFRDILPTYNDVINMMYRRR